MTFHGYDPIEIRPGQELGLRLNHAFVTLPKNIPPDDLNGLLREVVQAKWGEALKVEREKNEWSVGSYPYGVSIWFGKPNRLELRKHHPCELSWWIQIFVQESIAKHYNGWCKDEGSGGRWRGKPDKYPTFKHYFDMLHAHIPEKDRGMIEYFWQEAIKAYPKELIGKYPESPYLYEATHNADMSLTITTREK
jgi:hypothetical protein